MIVLYLQGNILEKYVGTGMVCLSVHYNSRALFMLHLSHV